MAAPGFVPARWVGTPAELTDPETGARVELVPGETVVEIPKAEAEDSANWLPVKAGRARSAAKTRQTRATRQTNAQAAADAERVAAEAEAAKANEQAGAKADDAVAVAGES